MSEQRSKTDEQFAIGVLHRAVRDMQLDAALMHRDQIGNGAIKWGELQKELGDVPAALTESEHCELLLAVANGKRLSETQWNLLVGARHGTGRAVPMPQAVRIALAGNLDILVTGTALQRLNFAKKAAHVASQCVLLSPSFSLKDGRKDRVIANGRPGAIAYGLWLLSDPSRGFLTDLCRCEYSQCGIFFFKRKGAGAGAPVRKYCSAAHGKQGDKEKAKVRMARIRAP